MKILLHIILFIAAILCLVPFVWLICASIKPAEHTFDTIFLPWGHLHELSLDNFRSLFQRRGFDRWLVNSIYLASVQTTIVVAAQLSLGGFSLAKYEFAGKRLLMGVMLMTMLLPYQVLLPSSYELMNKFGWMNAYLAIVVPGAVSVFGIFLFRQAMAGVPDELLQAARVDGCSELRLWWDIALPVVRPMIGAFTLMAFLGAGTATSGPPPFCWMKANTRYPWAWRTWSHCKMTNPTTAPSWPAP